MQDLQLLHIAWDKKDRHLDKPSHLIYGNYGASSSAANFPRKLCSSDGGLARAPPALRGAPVTTTHLTLREAIQNGHKQLWRALPMSPSGRAAAHHQSTPSVHTHLPHHKQSLHSRELTRKSETSHFSGWPQKGHPSRSAQALLIPCPPPEFSWPLARVHGTLCFLPLSMPPMQHAEPLPYPCPLLCLPVPRALFSPLILLCAVSMSADPSAGEVEPVGLLEECFFLKEAAAHPPPPSPPTRADTTLTHATHSRTATQVLLHARHTPHIAPAPRHPPPATQLLPLPALLRL